MALSRPSQKLINAIIFSYKDFIIFLSLLSSDRGDIDALLSVIVRVGQVLGPRPGLFLDMAEEGDFLYSNEGQCVSASAPVRGQCVISEWSFFQF